MIKIYNVWTEKTIKFTDLIPNVVNDSFFQFTQSFQQHYGPKVGSSSTRNEYQEPS
jgi:hypothetical protein